MRGLKLSFTRNTLPHRDLATPQARQHSKIDRGAGARWKWWGVPTMSVSPGCSATNPSARSWVLASIARSNAITIEDGYSVRADISAINAQIRQSAATACGLVNDFASLPGIKGPLGIAGDVCSHRRVIAFFNLMAHLRAKASQTPNEARGAARQVRGRHCQTRSTKRIGPPRAPDPARS